MAPCPVPKSAKPMFFETTISGPHKGLRGSLLRSENASSGALACGKVFVQDASRKVAVLRAVSIGIRKSVVFFVFLGKNSSVWGLAPWRKEIVGKYESQEEGQGER